MFGGYGFRSIDIYGVGIGTHDDTVLGVVGEFASDGS